MTLKLKLLILLFYISSNLFGQDVKTDSLYVVKEEKSKFKYESLIIPASLITFGFVAEQNDALELFNAKIQNKITENIDDRITIDDFSQYVPFLSVYGLNSLGYKGKHNFKDRTIILGTAYLTMGISVNGLKSIVDEQRPDGSSNNTFPSGHTATAFMGAEFLYQEYKDKSKWIGVAGYGVAALTGYYRMANNRHWFSDVVGGAGIGILSTKFAYWVHPFLKKKIFRDKKRRSGVILPYYNGKEYGLNFTLTLNRDKKYANR